MHNDIEPQAATLVGQLVFSFARLDFMLALALRNLIPSSTPDDLNPMIERLGFKERMDTLKDVVSTSQRLNPVALEQFDAWFPTADRLRQTRNAFVHGRWGMQTRETLFNASTKVGKALSGGAKIYSVPDLESEAAVAKQVLSTFEVWHRKHVVGAA